VPLALRRDLSYYLAKLPGYYTIAGRGLRRFNHET
jgi:hypothetical protein